MSDWKQRDYLFIEELNSNDGIEQRLTGFKSSQTVQDLKQAIAVKLNNPEGWSSVSLFYFGKELANRKSES